MSHAKKSEFWTNKPITEFTTSEWESLCDGCGKCCIIRLEDEETGAIYMTDVACKLFDGKTCRCSNYENRQKYVSDCVKLTPENLSLLDWMPQTCAYRLVNEGRPLPDYHHLISGSRETIHERGMSVRGAVISEWEVSEEAHATRVVVWPGEPEID